MAHLEPNDVTHWPAATGRAQNQPSGWTD